jgi:glutamyl/glutaminyl-tRNA synthetase
MIVTRFAPSPTGYLHIGGARTALFCYLMARRHGGRMILRIEDTDQKRNTPTATQQVIDDLRWLGIEWDEGPDVGGPAGPYLQSQRLDLYNSYARKLIDAGLAYYCFDTTEDLNAMRQQAVEAKKTFTYSRPETFPNERDVQKARDEGRPVVIRFMMPNEDIVVSDVVRGEVRFAAGEFGDFVIIKSDGYPTYHFACVIDDELMRVTHIIRGQEHLMNTPCHLALQRALGFRTPTYAHISVTVSESGGKLSKRERAKSLLDAIKNLPSPDFDALAAAGSVTRPELDSFLAGESSLDQPNITALAEHLHVHLPEINVVDFCRSGYIPEALMNFGALLGWNPGGDREIMTRDDLIASFDLNRLTKTNSLFDRQKLIAFNTEQMRMIPVETLLKHFKHYLVVNDSPMGKLDDAALSQLLAVSAGARTLVDVEAKCQFIMLDDDHIEYDPQAVKKVLQKADASALLSKTRDALADLSPWDKHSLHHLVEKLCTENNVGMGKIAQPLRVAVTGTTVSPGIDDTLVLLGKDKTLKRIDNTLRQFGG